MRITAIPAYGRVYQNEEQCLRDWEAGLDFKIASGPYFSNRDMVGLKAQGYREIQISVLTYVPGDRRFVLITL